MIAASSEPPLAAAGIEAALLAVVALVGYILSCGSATALERARLQWAGWGVVVAGALALAITLMHQLVGWPDGLGVPIVVSTLFVPIALAFSAFDRVALRIDRLLVRTIEVGGLVVLVGIVYVVVVLGFGESPTDSERRVLGLSMVAAAIAALLFVPARNWLEEVANRRVYGNRQAPDEPLQTFGARMSRAIPLEELLLQLAESLKRSMQLAAAEVWTGTDGLLERAAAVPYRETHRVRLREEEVAVVGRAKVSGNAWVQVWLPGLLEEHPGLVLRVAPLVHSGDLLGVVVCARTPDQPPFNDEEERVLTELAAPGCAGTPQLRARHGAASIARRPAHRERGIARVPRAHRRVGRPVAAPDRAQPARRRAAAPRRARGEARARAPAGRERPRLRRTVCSKSCAPMRRPRSPSCASSPTASTRRC